MNKKIIPLLTIPALGLVACGPATSSSISSSVTPPTIVSFTADKTSVYTGEGVTFDATIEGATGELTYTYNIPDGSGLIEGDVISFVEGGVFDVTLTVSDAYGNSVTSSPVSIDVYDQYDWGEEAEALMLENVGYIMPRSREMEEFTCETLVNLAGTVLGIEVDVAFEQELLDNYLALLGLEGYLLNETETAYLASMYTTATYTGVYELKTEDTDYSYIRLQMYVYEGTLCIEERFENYVSGATWNSDFASFVLKETSQYIPSFEFIEPTDGKFVYLTDYTNIMSSMVAYAMQCRLFGASEADLASYQVKLTEIGWDEYGMFMDEEGNFSMLSYYDSGDGYWSLEIMMNMILE